MKNSENITNSPTDNIQHGIAKPMLSSRLFKFRAWIRNEIMVNVLSIDFNNEFITWDDNQYDRCIPPNKCYEIESFCDIILLQFSGLKDKNGKEIYEGDIVTDGVGKYKIIYDLKLAGYQPYCIFRDDPENYCEVIGNIYENPELL